MKKYRIVYLISNENRWDHLLQQLKHINEHPELIDHIAIVVVDTAILSCLKNTIFTDLKAQISFYKAQQHTDFFLCNNTCIKYGITNDLILPEFELVKEGGILKALELESEGFNLFILGL